MAGRLHVVLSQRHRPIRVDNHGRTDNAHVRAAVILLLTPGTPGLENLVVGVRGQREGEGLLLRETFERAIESADTPMTE